MKKLLAFVVLTSYWGPGPSSPSTPSILTDVNSQVFKLMKGRGGGTGWVVNYKGRRYTITNSHVCGDSDEMKALQGLDEEGVQLKVLGRDEDHDLCILEPVPNRSGLTLGKEQTKKRLKVIGYPHLRPLTKRLGEIIAEGKIDITTRQGLGEGENCSEGEKKTQRQFYIFNIWVCVKSYQTYWTDIEVYPGNSGSPVLNSDDKVVAIVFAADLRVNQGFVIGLKYIREFLEKFVNDSRNNTDYNETRIDELRPRKDRLHVFFKG